MFLRVDCIARPRGRALLYTGCSDAITRRNNEWSDAHVCRKWQLRRVIKIPSRSVEEGRSVRWACDHRITVQIACHSGPKILENILPRESTSRAHSAIPDAGRGAVAVRLCCQPGAVAVRPGPAGVRVRYRSGRMGEGADIWRSGRISAEICATAEEIPAVSSDCFRTGVMFRADWGRDRARRGWCDE